MPRKGMFHMPTIEEAVLKILPYLEDTGNNAHKAIYFDGWRGLAASVVLRSIAENPPSSLLNKFKKIIHIDCSRWKSRRALQRTIVKELKLPQWVMDVIDRQDDEDDFIGVDESSRSEIEVVATEIHQALREQKYLVVFHNGSDDTIDLEYSGIPLSLWGTRVLWTFRGRLRLNSNIRENVDNSHLHLYSMISGRGRVWDYLLQKEAGEIVAYLKYKPARVVEECYSYLLSLNSQGGDIMDYNWATHASNYWVCDGIIEEGQADKAWEVAGSLHEQIHIEDYLSNVVPYFGNELETPRKRWILGTDNPVVHLESTSFFLATTTRIFDPSLTLTPLPNGMFHPSNKLRVLKLCHCTFSFSLPPFYCCHNLRFLALDCCKDQREEDEKQDIPAMDFLKTLWVLEICHTDWELDLSREIIEKMATNIREVHINKGRFWHINFAWRKLQNLRKLRVIEPTCPWETGEKDEFTNMVKMESLNLSGNFTIQVLPRLSGSTSIKTMVLDGCLGLEHVEGLPLSLESFSFDVGPKVDNYKKAKITRISITGCSSLSDFRLRGSFPNLEKLDLSGTKLKTLDLRAQVVQIPFLQRLMLLGCEKLRAVLWPKEGMPQISLLCIDTRGGGEVGRIIQDYEMLAKGYFQAYVAMMDIRFIQSLVLPGYEEFCWKDNRFILNLCLSASDQWFGKERMGSRSTGKICRSPALIPQDFYKPYTSITIDDITMDHDYTSAPQFQPLGYHVQIGEGISNTRLESLQGMKDIIFVMNKAKSLYVHDNSSITTTISEHTIEGKKLTWEDLKQCQVVRCPKMQTVFITNYDDFCFNKIETFRAADLPMVHSIWTKGMTFIGSWDAKSFAKLQSIHLCSCPRLAFALPLSWNAPGSYFPNLETLHIINCGDMKDVFPVEPMFLAKIATDRRKGILEFPKLKHIYMHELYKLQHICEAKMFAPKLKKVRLRGCWGVRRLPSVTQYSRPVVDCEKDWWEKLEWDGLEVGHDPSLFKPHHSSYYKMPLPRVSVLR